MWILYDPKVFMTKSEYYLENQCVIYMIAPSSSSPELQIALVPDRAECLTELSQPILCSRGNEICDTLRFFCGDTPC